jgi:hypothetical protein
MDKIVNDKVPEFDTMRMSFLRRTKLRLTGSSATNATSIRDNVHKYLSSVLRSEQASTELYEGDIKISLPDGSVSVH